jgi:hypothetical protein
MASKPTFTRNSYLLIYFNQDNGLNYSYRFDNLVGMKATLGTGLYFEGTAKTMAYSKGQSNPVEFVFSKKLTLEDNSVYGEYNSVPFSGKQRFNVNNGDVSEEEYQENSIFEWAKRINGAAVSRSKAVIYSEVRDNIKDRPTYKLVPFLELTGAYPTSATLGTGWGGVRLAKLTFKSDAFKANAKAKFK